MQTGSCFRRDDDGALIECRSFEDEAGNVWTDEIIIEQAQPVTDE